MATVPLLWCSGDDPVGLYVHIPFCRSICTYCAFARGEYDARRAEAWLDGLAREVEYRGRHTWIGRPRLDTVFLGGGTPSTLLPGQWRRLGRILHDAFDILPEAEFTSEANPESASRPETAAAMVEAGVNRVSLGVQSLDPRELSLLGRAHGPQEVTRAVHVLREVGLSNINLDIMFGLPGQDARILDLTLGGLLALNPEHVSAYCLSFEPGTPLALDKAAGHLAPPPDDLVRGLYDRLLAALAATGFGQYEISNFARPGRECRHNLRYWTRADVFALGPSAHALARNHRWANPAPLESWLAAYVPDGRPPRPEPVPEGEARFEWVFLNLRLNRGLEEAAFAARWGESFEAVYGPVAATLVAAGHLERQDGWLRLADQARFVSDGVLCEFAPD